jgi:hypothetical protein
MDDAGAMRCGEGVGDLDCDLQRFVRPEIRSAEASRSILG